MRKISLMVGAMAVTGSWVFLKVVNKINKSGYRTPRDIHDQALHRLEVAANGLYTKETG